MAKETKAGATAPAFNRTLLELKSGTPVDYDRGDAPFNRTLLELKYTKVFWVHDPYHAFNRTLLELK